MAAETTDIRIYDDLESLSAAAAEGFAKRVGMAIELRGSASVALSGGRTPRRLFDCLVRDYRDTVPWDRVHFYWADERYVPPTDAESNVKLARDGLLRALEVPERNIHPPATSLDDPSEAARAYERELPEGGRLDLVLLGLGEDGHTASLFPGHAALEVENRFVVAVTDSPKPPPTRLTMTLALFDRARAVYLQVAGEAKREALGRSLAPSSKLPAARIRPSSGAVVWWVDRAAAPSGT